MIKNFQKIKNSIVKFIKEDQAVTAIEYGLIGAATAVAIIAALVTIKANLSTIFTSIATAL